MARNGTVSRVSARQQQAIVCLLHEASIVAAADAAGVSRRTLYRWLTERSFAEAYTAAKAEAFGQAMAVARANCGKAVKFLVELIDNGAAPLSPRVQAAKAVIDFARTDTLEDLDARLAELEAIVTRQNGGPPADGA